MLKNWLIYFANLLFVVLVSYFFFPKVIGWYNSLNPDLGKSAFFNISEGMLIGVALGAIFGIILGILSNISEGMFDGVFNGVLGGIYFGIAATIANNIFVGLFGGILFFISFSLGYFIFFFPAYLIRETVKIHYTST